jgi:hypothetical protein
MGLNPRQDISPLLPLLESNWNPDNSGIIACFVWYPLKCLITWADGHSIV